MTDTRIQTFLDAVDKLIAQVNSRINDDVELQDLFKFDSEILEIKGVYDSILETQALESKIDLDNLKSNFENLLNDFSNKVDDFDTTKYNLEDLKKKLEVLYNSVKNETKQLRDEAEEFRKQVEIILNSEIDTKLDEIQEIVDFIKLNKTNLENLGIDNIAGLQTALSNKTAELIAHKNDTSNPHNVTKNQLGLENVNNTADLDKPLSTAAKEALSFKSNIADIVDNLISTLKNAPLSANQGRVLKEQIRTLQNEISSINTVLQSDDSSLDEIQEIVNNVKQNKSMLEALNLSNIAETSSLKHFTNTLKTKLESLPTSAELNDLISSQFPFVGFIGIYSGSPNNIPQGWYICDGQNDTPNLTDKFVIGASSTRPAGTTGGSFNTQNTTLSVNQMPSHSHSITSYTSTSNFTSKTLNSDDKSNRSYSNNTSSSGGNQAHNHSFIPPYYALSYIMYKGV